MTEVIKTLQLEDVFYYHDLVITSTGGDSGVRDRGLVESAHSLPSIFPSLYCPAAISVRTSFARPSLNTPRQRASRFAQYARCPPSPSISSSPSYLAFFLSNNLSQQTVLLL